MFCGSVVDMADKGDARYPDIPQDGFPEVDTWAAAQDVSAPEEQFWDCQDVRREPAVSASAEIEPAGDDDYEEDPDRPCGEPCPVCSEVGACAWDSFGRPMIHTLGEE
jgi:hypothetical protein